MTNGVRQRYSAAFKQNAVAQMADCPNLSALAQQLGVRRKFLYLWRAQSQQLGAAAFARGPGRPRRDAAPTPPGAAVGLPPPAAPPPRGDALAAAHERIAALERQLGQKQLEVEFFARTFAHVRGAMPSPTTSGATASTAVSTPDSRAKVTPD